MHAQNPAANPGPVAAPGPYAYDAFATYATDPDRDLVRALEAFLEGFHRRPALPEAMRRELELCVDGRDFVIPRRLRSAPQPPAAVSDIVEAYLRRSRSLLVLGGPLSRHHPWIDHEVLWWLANRPDGPIYFALTHGNSTAAADIMPPALLEGGGGDLPIYFDLRGFHSASSRHWHRPWARGRSAALAEGTSAWRSVRPFREEASKIAARLLSDALGGDYSVDDVEAAFAEDERRAARRRLLVVGLAGVGMAAASAVAWQSLERASESTTEARAQAHLRRSRVLADQGGAALAPALAHAASALMTRPDGPAVAAAFTAMQDLVPITRILRPDGGDPAWVVRFVADDRFVLVGGRSSVLRLVRASDGDVKARVDLQASGIRHIAYHPATGGIFVGTDKGLVRLALRLRGDEVELVETGRVLAPHRVGGLVLDGARARVIAGLLQSGELWSFPVEDRGAWAGTRHAVVKDPRFAEPGGSDVQSGVYGLALAGDRLVATGIDGVVSIFAAAKPEQAPRQFVHPHAIFAMAVSHRGRELAVADDEGGLSVYDVATATLQRAEKGAARSASVGRTLDGRLALSGTDRLPNAGLAIGPDDDVIAVTSHDRSVRFLSFADLSPLGIAVHRAAPRDVAFDGDGQAVTAADDGAMQIVRPAAQPEVMRIAGIAGFTPLPNGRLVAWPPTPPAKAGLGNGSAAPAVRPLRLLDPATGARTPFGTAERDVLTATALASGEFAFRSAASSRIHVLAGAGGTPCPLLQHRNDPGAVEMVHEMMAGPDPGMLATVTKRTDSEAQALHLWDLGRCTVGQSWPTSGPAAVAKGAVATLDGERRVIVRSAPYAEPRAIAFESPVSAMSIGEGGRTVLVALGRSPGLCLCEANRSSGAGGACGDSSTAYACHPLNATLAGPRGPQAPSAVRLSPSGRFAVLQHRSALLLGTASSGWTFQPASPEQLRPVTPPFAFSPDETMLAVPAGESGARLLDMKTGRVVAEFPTPSRVMRIAFTAGSTSSLVTLDGSMLRVWDWRPASIRARICERWSPDLAGDDSSETPPTLPRDSVCGPA